MRSAVELEALGADGAAVRRLHLILHRLRHLLSQFQALGHRRFQMAAGVHAAQDGGLGGIKGRSADPLAGKCWVYPCRP